MKEQCAPVQILLGDADALLADVLVGAYLDSFVVQSVQITLRFLSTKITTGKLIGFEIVCNCDAAVGGPYFMRTSIEEQFFLSRKNFISAIYELIGKEILSVSLFQNGNLAISMDASSILLSVTEVDSKLYDFAWDILLENAEDTTKLHFGSISCAFDADNTAAFYKLGGKGDGVD